MGREIKFRGIPNSGNWRYGAYVKHEGEPGEIYFVTMRHPDDNRVLETDWCYVDENTVGQYTGVKDKNGVEIYEGDLVATQFKDSELLGVVRWHKNGYFYISETNEDDDNDFAPLGTLQYKKIDGENITLEVKGNIHHNPSI